MASIEVGETVGPESIHEGTLGVQSPVSDAAASPLYTTGHSWTREQVWQEGGWIATDRNYLCHIGWLIRSQIDMV